MAPPGDPPGAPWDPLVRRRRHRAQQLPALGHAMVGVAGKQRIQDGGARARCAGDEERLFDGLIADPRVLVEVADELQPPLEYAQQEAAREPAPHHVELRLPLEGAENEIQGLEEAVAVERRVAEIFDASIGQAKAGARRRVRA